MSPIGKQAVAAHRKRLQQRGLARIELRAPKEDAPLLRELAGVLADPIRGAQMRRLVRRLLSPHAEMGLKELLAAAPLDLELEFDRSRDNRGALEF